MTTVKWQSLTDIELQQHFAQLPNTLHTYTLPTRLPQPQLLSCNGKLAAALGIDPCSLRADSLEPVLAGAKLITGSHPIAMKYTGHQFGGYNPDLGDGRGLLLGEYMSSQGILFDFHLKGAGKTPYSRFGDGRAVVRSSIREYLVGEALTFLNIPSTRALAICASPEAVQRETIEPAAAILRVSPCHIRFGHFEYLYYTRQWEELKQLADYVINRYFNADLFRERYPDLLSDQPYKRYRAFLCIVRDKSAELVAGWQTYGFLHGVMNTDNMSIIGETFDHGPFAFIDFYDSAAVYNHTDHQGRYAFGKQPSVMHWNLTCLAQALMPLLKSSNDPMEPLSEKDKVIIQSLLDDFHPLFARSFDQRTAERLGIHDALTINRTRCKDVINDWYHLLQSFDVDFHRLYLDITLARASQVPLTGASALQYWLKEHSDPALSHSLSQWLKKYESLLQSAGLTGDGSDSVHDSSSVEQMKNANPIYILRTHIAQKIIDDTHQGDFDSLNQWLTHLQSPYLNKAQCRDAELHLDPFLLAPQQRQPISLSCSS